ncbi:MAG: hypothetical protein NXI18_09850 [Alphaproteobacteria bacterium]|nr:hypothetical protein [Alphaproteobacteria bacterium]
MRDYNVNQATPTLRERQSCEGAVSNFRLRDLERRVGRIEAFLLGILCAIALSVLGGLAALIGLPAP